LFIKSLLRSIDLNPVKMPSRLTAAAAFILSLVILTTTVVAPSVAQDAASKDSYRFQEASLQHIPDYDVLSLAYPPNLGLLIANGRDGYLAEMSHDSAPIQRLRLLLGLGEYTYDATFEGCMAISALLPERWRRSCLSLCRKRASPIVRKSLRKR
jgi:hypothetical protein